MGTSSSELGSSDDRSRVLNESIIVDVFGRRWRCGLCWGDEGRGRRV